MHKIVFFCIPAQGHTNPTLGVVQELVARGNEVWYYSYEIMREKIESTGAHFIPCDAYDPQMQLSKEDNKRIGTDLAFSTELIVNLTLALDDAILKEIRVLKPDVIVSDSVAFWGKLIAKKLKIPFVSSTTTFAFNQYSAKVMKQSGAGLFSMLCALPKINKSLKKLRQKGYAIKSILDIIANDNNTRTIVYTSKMFQPYAETFSDNYAFVGPILRKSVETYEKTKQKTIFISLGSVNNEYPEFYQNCIKALEKEAYQVILSVGNDTNIAAFGDIPSNCIVNNTVDQMAVLQIADVFLTHCGMNSVSEALYHGIPLVLSPRTPEQQGVANRVYELGAGIFLKDTSPQTIRDSLKKVLSDESYYEKAREISTSFHQCGGASLAADFILRTIVK